MPSRKEKPPSSPPKVAPSPPAKAAESKLADARAAEESTSASGRLRRVPKGGPSKPELKRWRALLVQMREKIQRSSRNLADEALKSSGQDFSVDHMADHGTDNFDQDFSLSLLEGETEVIRDIEDAIDKIDGRNDLPYGLCEECADVLAEDGPDSVPNPWIPKGRLDVLPYARLCVAHQERQEGAGGRG